MSRTHHGISAPEVQKSLKGQVRHLIPGLHIPACSLLFGIAFHLQAAPQVTSPSLWCLLSAHCWGMTSGREASQQDQPAHGQARQKAEVEHRVIREGFLEEWAWNRIMRAWPTALTPRVVRDQRLPSLGPPSTRGDTAREGNHFAQWGQLSASPTGPSSTRRDLEVKMHSAELSCRPTGLHGSHMASGAHGTWH